MALRVLRLLAVASILAFGMIARAAGATYATTDDLPADSPLTVVELPPGDLDQPPSNELPPPPDPTLPASPPDPVESPPAEPAESETPPAMPPTESPEPVPEPVATDAPSPNDPAPETQPESPVPAVPSTISDPAVADPSLIEPLTAVPAAPPTPAAVLPFVNDPGPTAVAAMPTVSPAPARQNLGASVVPAVAAPAALPLATSQSVAWPMIVPGAGQPTPVAPAAVPPAADSGTQTADAARSEPPAVWPHVTGVMLLDELEEASAGIVAGVAGVAVTNRAPASVAVAIEFGRAGGGWAGAIVFNLWLRRQLRERRMSQRRLAALSGVDHSTISRLLTDDRRPSLATATKLARALRKVHGESDTAAYFERVPEEMLFPARRVEMALRADELLGDDDVGRLMSAYLETRRRRQAAASSNGSASIDHAAALTRDASDRR